MISYQACRESLNPKRLFDLIRYKLSFFRHHPNYFNPDGLVVFTGAQGTGKTLSAVNYVENLLKYYPKSILVTNLKLSNYPFDDKRIFQFNDSDDLSRYSNGEYGVIYLIDEIQLYFNSLQSKNINPEVMAQISQQRKQRKHIVATSQVFGRMAKPLREQFSSVLVCKKLFGFIQFNKLVDRDSIGENDNGTTLKGSVKRRFFWLHSPKDYSKYDTYYVIKQNKFISEEEKKVGIYGTELSNCRWSGMQYYANCLSSSFNFYDSSKDNWYIYFFCLW